MVPMVESAEQARADRRLGEVPAGRAARRRRLLPGRPRAGRPRGDAREGQRRAAPDRADRDRGGRRARRGDRGRGRDRPLWIGHFDLTTSLGAPGQFWTEAHTAAVDRVFEACRRHGKAVGTMANDVADGLALAAKGFTAFAFKRRDGLLRGSGRVGCRPCASSHPGVRPIVSLRATTRVHRRLTLRCGSQYGPQVEPLFALRTPTSSRNSQQSSWRERPSPRPTHPSRGGTHWTSFF